MKICQSCGAELDDKEARCPICDFAFPSPEEPQKVEELAGEAVPGILDDIKARIRGLSGDKQEPSPGVSPVQTAVTEPVTEETQSEEEKQEKKPEIAEKPEEKQAEGSEAEPRRTKHYRPLTLPGMASKDVKPTIPTKQGRKISAEEASSGKGGHGVLIAAAAIAMVAVLIFAAWYFVIGATDLSSPAVDGHFEDWAETVKYQSYFLSDNEDLDFKETSIQYHEGSVLWYFETSGPIFSSTSALTPVISTYALFVDADGDPWTGFSLMDGFGAEAFLSISGSSGKKNASLTQLYEFVGDDVHNWSSWKVLYPLTVGATENKIETSFQLRDYFNETSARFVAISFDGISSPSATLPFSNDPGILLIKQTSLVPSSTGVISGGANRPFLQVDITGYGAAKPIQLLRPTLTGLSGSYNLGPVDWNESTMGEGRSFIFTIDTKIPEDTGKFVQASIMQSGVVSDYKSIVIIGAPAKGYVATMPLTNNIDGIFKEWINVETDKGDPTIGNPNVDILNVGNATSSSKTCFYIKFLGKAMGGTLIPIGERVPSPNMPSGVGEKKRITGEDILRIYIDDPTKNSTAPSPINGTGMNPDYMVLIQGRNGVITDERVMYWTTGWYWNHGITVDATCEGSELELSISLGNLSNATFAVVSDDWMGHSDNMTCAF